ncbi:hypothetical protein IJ076_01055 [Candidatus Saccharibacteria bacterium]|nr:hypothetical protein [Candidatus Saccharibacteria bacterium]
MKNRTNDKVMMTVLWVIIGALSLLVMVLLIAFFASIYHRNDTAVEEPITDSSVESISPVVTKEVDNSSESSSDATVNTALETDSKDVGSAEEAVETSDDNSEGPVMEQTEDDFDPYGMYVITEDWVHNEANSSWPHYAVEHDGKLYTLSREIPDDNLLKYHVGYQIAFFDPINETFLFYDDDRNIGMQTNIKGRTLTTAGNFPIIQVKKGEPIRVYASTPQQQERILDAEFYGYTINAAVFDGFHPIVDCVTGFWNTQPVYVNNVDLLDKSGASVDDVRDLNYGEEYLYTWYEKTDYYEIPVVANSLCFAVLDTYQSVAVDPTKNGYFQIDTSSLSLGYHAFKGQVIFEIVDEFHDNDLF